MIYESWFSGREESIGNFTNFREKKMEEQQLKDLEKGVTAAVRLKMHYGPVTKTDSQNSHLIIHLLKNSRVSQRLSKRANE